MFPSLDTNGFDPFNPHQTTMLPTFTTHIQSPNSHHHHPLPSLPFSPDFLDESFLINQFLLQEQDAEASLVESSENVCKKLVQKKKKEKCVDDTTSEKVPRKKRDRHSKICTAQGPRDRRMRLSLQIARKFFDLQDMLGFDKASKTIEWLISKSKTSIKQVKERVAASGGGDEHLQVDQKEKNETMKVSKRRTKTMESSSMKKESREKARERARERTMTKMKMRLSSAGIIDNSKTLSDPNQETRYIKITSGAQMEEQEWRSTNVNIIERFLGLTSESISSSIFRDSEESYTSLTIRGTTTTPGMVTPSEHNTTSVASVEEERSPISFPLYDYICY